jgi:serine/threonine-protein kinase
MSDTLSRLETNLSGRYAIEREIGRGGMAVVYLAQDLKHGRSVAIKVLLPELAHAIGPTRFLREIEIAAQLTHPNILPLHDSGDADGLLYYVMPYVEGESLRQRMTRERQLPIEEAIGIIRDVADALTYAHENGVIHRDIKPENILLAAGRPVVTDFGIARAADVTGDKRLTETGLAIGTPRYMSPEQATGDAAIDERTDVYSLGCIAYELLGGEAPFSGSTPRAVLIRVLSDPPPPLRHLRPAVPEGIERVVEQALAKVPADRFDSAAGFARALAEASTAQAMSEVAHHKRREKERRTVAAVTAVGLLVAGGWWMVATLGGPAIERLAVLPPVSQMNDTEQAFLVEGVHNALISELQQIGIAVIARTSVMRYRDAQTPTRQIAEELGVDALVESSVWSTGDSVDVQVQLVDGASAEYVGAPIMRREALRNVATLYRDVAGAIAIEIESVLSPQAQARLAEARPVNPEAYAAYLRGQSHYEMLTLPDAQAAVQYFETAIDIDPDYAPAYAGLALGWGVQMQMGFLEPAVATPLAVAAAERALELDSTLVEVQYAAAVVRTWYVWDLEGAGRAFRKAIEINPNYPHARAFYGHYLTIMGHPDEALEQMKLAVELDPFNELFQGLYGIVLGFEGRHEDAIERFRLALRTSPNNPMALGGMARALHELGDDDEAMAILRQSNAVHGYQELDAAMAAGFAEGGYPEAMRRQAEILAARAATSFVRATTISSLFAQAGDVDRALDWLERGYEQGDPGMPYTGVWPGYGILRDDPRFLDLVQRLGLAN